MKEKPIEGWKTSKEWQAWQMDDQVA